MEGQGWILLSRGIVSEIFVMMKYFCILTVLVVTQISTYMKEHKAIYMHCTGLKGTLGLSILSLQLSVNLLF